jgi:hypothetical protein
MAIKRNELCWVLSLLLITQSSLAIELSNLTASSEVFVSKQATTLNTKQGNLKNRANATLTKTNEVATLFAVNKSLEFFLDPLENITKTLTTIKSASKFIVSDRLDFFLTDCEKLEILIKSLDNDLEIFLQSSRFYEKSLQLLNLQIQPLKIGYITSFIHFNKPQKDNLLLAISMLEKLTAAIEKFLVDVKAAIRLSGRVFYNLRVITVTECRETTSTSTKPPKSNLDDDTIYFS